MDRKGGDAPVDVKMQCAIDFRLEEELKCNRSRLKIKTHLYCDGLTPAEVINFWRKSVHGFMSIQLDALSTLFRTRLIYVICCLFTQKLIQTSYSQCDSNYQYQPIGLLFALSIPLAEPARSCSDRKLFRLLRISPYPPSAGVPKSPST